MTKKTAREKLRSPVKNAEAELKHFVDKFEPERGALIRAARRALRKRFPAAMELVYDNYNFFVIGYSPTERPSDAILSIAAGSNGVSICFIHGARLPDPARILTGAGKQTRFLRIKSAADLARPEVVQLLLAAVAKARTQFGEARGKLIIRSISTKQRPRRKVSVKPKQPSKK